MKATAFRHLPELGDRITLADDSGLRATDEVFAAWDARARALGLEADWRLSDAALEASRCTVLDQLEAGEDLWIFGYGSLMWDPGVHFSEVRRATLEGYQRRFSYWTTIGRGAPDRPGLVLSLEPRSGHCQGLVFRIDAAIARQESRYFWRREMIVGGYQPRVLPLSTPQGKVNALVLASNPGHHSHAGEMTLHEAAGVIASARGSHGTNLDYLRQLENQLDRLGIADDYVRQLSRLIGREFRPAPATSL